MASMMDRGDSYRVGYVGAATLNQLATGLGVLQKPLKDLYFAHRKPGVPRSLPERYLTMTGDGMVMAYYDEDAPTGAPPVEEFYPITHVLLWDAVRFVTVTGSEKKDKKSVKAAFEPLDNDHSRVKDNLFVSLDKKQHHLTSLTHPAIFTCVIRRRSGVRLLDAHAFVVRSDETALGIVSALNQVHARFTSGEVQETGVFGYTPFGPSASVSSASGRPMLPGAPTPQGNKPAGAPTPQGNKPANNQPKTHSKNSGGKHSVNVSGDSIGVTAGGHESIQTELHSVTHNIYTQRHSNSAEDKTSKKPNNKPNNTKDSYRASSRPNNTEDSYRASRKLLGSQSSATSRVFHLSQEDLFSGGQPELSLPPDRGGDGTIFYEGEREAVDEDEDGYQYLPHITHSLERSRNTGEISSSKSSEQRKSSSLDNRASIVSESNLVPSSVLPKKKKSQDQINKKSQPKYDNLDSVSDIIRSGNSTPNTQSLEHSSQNSSRYGSTERSNNPSAGYSEKNKPFNYLGGSGGNSSIGSNSSSRNNTGSPKKLNTGGGDGEPDHSMGQGYSLLSGGNHLPPPRRESGDSPLEHRREPQSGSHPPGFSPGDENTSRQIFRELLHYQKQQDSVRSPSQVSASRPGQLRRPKSPGYLDRPPGSLNHTPDQDSSPEDNTAVPMTQHTATANAYSVSANSKNCSASGGVSASSSTSSSHNASSDPFPPRDRPVMRGNKPVARVPPHMVTGGVRVLPGDGAGSEHDLSSVKLRETGKRPKSGLFSPTSPGEKGLGLGSPPRRVQSQYNITGDGYPSNSGDKHKNKNKPQKGTANDNSNWQLGSNSRNKEDPARSHSQRDLENNMDDKLGEKLLLSKKKDAEIASVMQGLRLDYRDTPTLTPGAPGGLNFEKSLGYFP